MTTPALLITFTSLALAGAMGVALMVLLRDNRRRAHARVAVLTRLAAADAGGVWADEAPVQERVDVDVPPRHPSPWTLRLGIAGALLLVAIALFAVASMRTPGGAAAASASGEMTTLTAPQPLELLSLQHARDRGGLTVTGQVQSPGGAAIASEVIATVFLFGSDGAFVGSGRVPLDTATLDSGATVSFSVSVGVTGPVARYRVSFRDGHGRALTHVDKRVSTTGGAQ